MFRFILKKLREEHIVCSRLGDEFKTGDFMYASLCPSLMWGGLVGSRIDGEQDEQRT